MTVTAHAYAAKIVGTSTVVPVEGGRLSLDAGTWPHATGTVEVPVPTDEDAAAFLAALDPRLNRRLEVTATVTQEGGQTVARAFNLGIRSRPMRLTDASITLALASDEALLEDYRTLTDDSEPYARQTSLRSICNYVLNKAIPGASLAAQPSIDRNVTAYWEAENLVTNPRTQVDLTGWERNSAVGVGAMERVPVARPVGVPGSGDMWAAQHRPPAATNQWTTLIAAAVPVTAGRIYAVSAFLAFHADAGSHVGHYRVIECNIDWFNAAGQFISRTQDASTGVLQVVGAPVSGWGRTSVVGVAPAGATHGRPAFAVLGVINAGGFIRATGAMMTEGVRVLPYHDGSTPNNAGYTYSWQGLPDASTSLRAPITERDPESLVWQAGQSAIDFLMTLVQSTGLRLVCDEQRVWTLRDENYTAPGQLNVRYGVNMLDADDEISRDNDTWFDAMVVAYRWTAPDGTQKRRDDAFALPGATRVIFVERATAFPGAGLAEYAVRRAQGRGREVSGTTVADWIARAEQPVTIVLPSQATQVGITQRVEFDLNNDRITVSSRTRDTPAGAIDLLQGTIDGLVGTIDNL